MLRVWTSAFGKSMRVFSLWSNHVVSRYTVNSSCSASKASDLRRQTGRQADTSKNRRLNMAPPTARRRNREEGACAEGEQSEK